MTDWECSVCTLINGGQINQCEACGALGPELWACPKCTFANSKESSSCHACGEMRRASLRLSAVTSIEEKSSSYLPSPSIETSSDRIGHTSNALVNGYDGGNQNGKISAQTPSKERSTDSAGLGVCPAMDAEAPVAIEKDQQQRQERYRSMKCRMREKEEERVRIKQRIAEDIHNRKGKESRRVETEPTTTKPPPTPRSSKAVGHDGSFEIAIRCGDHGVVSGTFSFESTLGEIRSFAVKKISEPPEAVSAASGSAGPSSSQANPRSGQGYQGGTFTLNSSDEMQRSRETYEAQKRKIMEEARQVRLREWRNDPSPAQKMDESAANAPLDPSEFVLMDPLTRRRFDEEHMELTLSAAKLEPKSVLILQRASITGLAIGSVPISSSRNRARSSSRVGESGRSKPKTTPRDASKPDPERDHMRQVAANAAVLRLNQGSTLVSDEELVTAAAAAMSTTEPTDNVVPVVMSVRSEAMDSRASAAAAAAEKRLQTQRTVQEQAAEAARRSHSPRGSVSRTGASAEGNAEDEETVMQQRRRELARRMKERAQQRKELLRKLEMERMERHRMQEELHQQRERQRLDRLGREAEVARSPRLNGEVVELRVRKLNGEILRRSFRPNDTMRTVLQAVLAHSSLEDDLQYSLLVPFPPREFIDEELDTTLSCAGLVPCGTLFLQNEATRGMLRSSQTLQANPRSAGMTADLLAGQNGPQDLMYEALLAWEEEQGAVSRGVSAGQISDLQSIEITDDILSSNPICTVCRSDFAEGEVAVELPCGHIYHRECIAPWLSRCRICPLCRQELQSSPAAVPQAPPTGGG